MNGLGSCFNCMLAKGYSHKNISKRLYTLITRRYKSNRYRNSEIKRYLQWIVDKKLFTKTEQIYLTAEHINDNFYVYCLSPELNTAILWHKAENLIIFSLSNLIVSY